ncbi:protein S40-4-like [Gastrolobium bilobum]|uniref:protein S40-4-like n=1 Tax=Gastrolobium bilobum TaxID=150636 RepID=UPI002AB23EAF|nr:protein S40-4-like [Gastrolobium bilobum]
MASRKSFLSKQNYIFQATSESHFNPKSTQEGSGVLEFDEAELWNSSTNNTNQLFHPSMEAKKALPGSRSSLKRASRKVDPVTPASLPVNIPDWSKILKEDYKEHRKWESDDDDVGDEDEGDHHGGIRVPPHEYLARTRGASLSVHEGIGRTLKGRDLRSVRNAIWKKVGFED